MEVVKLVAEADTAAARFVCSGTHLGRWRDHEPSGRFRVDDVYFFEFTEGGIARARRIEDNCTRMRQLVLLRR